MISVSNTTLVMSCKSRYNFVNGLNAGKNALIKGDRELLSSLHMFKLKCCVSVSFLFLSALAIPSLASWTKIKIIFSRTSSDFFSTGMYEAQVPYHQQTNFPA